MYAHIIDANIAGHLTVTTDSPETLAELLTDTVGRWHDYTGDGVAILSNPVARVYTVDPDTVADPYPDAVVGSDDGGITFAVYPA